MEKRERRLRIWENESIKFEKKYEWDSKVVNNEDVYSIQGDDYCLITSKNRYNEFLRILEECKQDFKNQKETAKQPVSTSYNEMIFLRVFCKYLQNT